VHVDRQLPLETHPEGEQYHDRHRPPDDAEHRQERPEFLGPHVADEFGEDRFDVVQHGLSGRASVRHLIRSS